MNTLLYILIATFLISLIAFIGALTLFLKRELLDKILLILVAFSAGALIGGAFLHLIPEAVSEVGFEETAVLKIFLYLILGFCSFFILEQFIRWHQHSTRGHQEIKPFSYLVLVSDAVHNFIDGLVIAASFVIALPVGIAASLAVALHEIPQEIGDFGVMVYGGMKRVKALFFNFLSAIFAVVGGIIGFFLAGKIGGSVVFLLPFAAGNFIYIASSDLIPEIKHRESLQKSLLHFFVFLLGIGLMLLLKLWG